MSSRMKELIGVKLKETKRYINDISFPHLFSSLPALSLNLLDVIENIKSTFELKINSSYKKLSSIYGMINDKLSIYDDRVNSVEKLLEEKILFTRDMKQKTGARLLNDYIDKLKTQITDLQGRQSTLDIE